MQASEDLMREEIIRYAKRILPVRAISPESGGIGESARADEICKILTENGLNDFQRYDTSDKNDVVRSNVVIKIGKAERTLWLIAHIDTVPVGDRNLWTRDPFSATVEENRIYGRGSSDDGQAVFLSLLLAKELKDKELKYNLGIAFVADEEVGSVYGIQYLLKQGIFKKDDLILVPDSGSEDGLDVEVAEKSILWIKFTVKGKQYHASRPDNAINAGRESMKFILELDSMLHEKYTAKDEIFNYPYSTFEPTKHEKNVDNVNTIPGLETIYMDCRILPKYDLDNVIDDISNCIRDFEKDSKAHISFEFMQKEQAPVSTSPESDIVKVLSESIRKIKGSEPRIVGIGGGTCAAFFRHDGMDAVVWSTTVPEVAHQADEYCIIDHIIGDFKILENILLKDEN
ncbi:MAG: M20 family metallo-hydrolase [Candidatus Thermoplasmatota archaeon]|jgi:succinyl-diaminopimelate desuccinylase|nr:M20 family metallo-hydrolase [Candidatus Thermoplasmatota archaeon]MCL5788089.1 M20 family metallo-hydrolase [Candidatus Thermoplasmatota archaeon]